MPAPKITPEQLTRMIEAYRERPSPKHVAKVAGVSLSTANKYITFGDPTRGVKPFAEEIRRASQVQSGVLRLTQTTRTIRGDYEQADLVASQALVARFQRLLDEALDLAADRAQLERRTYERLKRLLEDIFGGDAADAAELAAKVKEGDTTLIKSIKTLVGQLKTPWIRAHEIRALGDSLRGFMEMQREHRDRIEEIIEMVREVGAEQVQARAGAALPPLDFERFQPQELERYLQALESGERVNISDSSDSDSDMNRAKTDPQGRSLRSGAPGDPLEFPPGPNGQEE